MSPHSARSEARRGAAGAAPTWPELAGLTLQLLALLAVVRGFRIQEDFGFVRLAPLLLIGFVANALAPARWRPPLFTLLSVASVFLVLPYPASGLLIAAALALLGICHLPLPFAARVGLLLACGGLLAALRSGRLPSPMPEIPTLVLPLLAAMFMFRGAIYLYDLRHERRGASIWERVSYFLMLPNVCFLLFPVVDWGKFRRTYYDAPAGEIYQKGLSWILRGLLQLLLYRIVYQYFVPAPGAIVDLWSFAQFVLASYLLYLHISGQFHLIVGVLCLFGFNLPPTHRLYYLAGGFNEFWRRINIYWRDFMTRLVFYPAFSALGGRSTTLRLIVATVAVFVSTWLLHSYQSFWLRGDFPLEARDAIFWGVLALLVVVTSLNEMRSRTAPAERDRSELGSALRLSASTVGTFTLICLLWSLWSTSGTDQWLAYASQARNSSLGDLLLLLAIPVVLVLVGTMVRMALARAGDPELDLAERRPLLYTAGGSLALIALLGAHNLDLLPTGPAETMSALRRNQLNVRDRQLADRGYYEGVVDAGAFASALWKGHLERPPGPEWAYIRDTPFVQFTDDVLEYRLQPGYSGSWREAPFNVNAEGYRDADHSVTPPPGTRRVALLGASYEMGAGVEDEQIYPAVLETLLDRRGRADGGAAVEVLNLSVGGYGMVQRAELARRELERYRPDLAVLTLYTTEDNRLLNNLTSLVAEELDAGPYLEDLFARLEIDATMSRPALRQALQSVTDEILAWTLDRLAEECDRHDIPLIAIMIPTVQDLELPEAQTAPAFARLRRLSEGAGIRTLEVDRPFDGRPGEEIRLAPWDLHVNVLGNRLLAEAVHDLLAGDPLVRRALDGPANDSRKEGAS